jgi:hypothetical protein
MDKPSESIHGSTEPIHGSSPLSLDPPPGCVLHCRATPGSVPFGREKREPPPDLPPHAPPPPDPAYPQAATAGSASLGEEEEAAELDLALPPPDLASARVAATGSTTVREGEEGDGSVRCPTVGGGAGLPTCHRRWRRSLPPHTPPSLEEEPASARHREDAPPPLGRGRGAVKWDREREGCEGGRGTRSFALSLWGKGSGSGAVARSGEWSVERRESGVLGFFLFCLYIGDGSGLVWASGLGLIYRGSYFTMSASVNDLPRRLFYNVRLG